MHHRTNAHAAGFGTTVILAIAILALIFWPLALIVLVMAGLLILPAFCYGRYKVRCYGKK